MTDVDLTDFHRHAENEDLRRQIVDLQLKLRSSKAKTHDLIQAVYQAAQDAAVILGRPPAVPKPNVDRRRGRPELCLLPVGDWHIGKETPSFGSDVAERRVRELAAKVQEITEIERAAHPVRECHLLLCGDFTDGVTVFPGQAFEVDSTLFQQLFRAAGCLEELLRSLLATFERVVVWCQTGNHGRLGRKGDMPRGDNTDRLLYRLVRERFNGTDLASRVAWHEPTNWYSIVEAGDYRALLVHGDQIKSFGGTPAFAILKKCNSWSSGVLPVFRDVFMGHFHNPLVLPLANGRGRVFISPSLESDSAYAAEVVAAASQPAQRLCYIDPVKARVTSERLIWLDQ